jgi:hypothetical protein
VVTNQLTGVVNLFFDHPAGTPVYQGLTYSEPTVYTVVPTERISSTSKPSGRLYFNGPNPPDMDGRNVYLSYYKGPTDVSSDATVPNYPDFTLYQYYLAFRILLRVNSGKATEESIAMAAKYEARRKNAHKIERLAQRTRLYPRLKTMNWREEDTGVVSVRIIP